MATTKVSIWAETPELFKISAHSPVLMDRLADMGGTVEKAVNPKTGESFDVVEVLVDRDGVEDFVTRLLDGYVEVDRLVDGRRLDKIVEYAGTDWFGGVNI